MLITILFQLPSPVAIRYEHTPDKISYVSQTGDLETTLGRVAAAGVPSGDISLTKMEFSDLEATIRFFENSGLDIPYSVIDSLCAVVIYSDEFDFVVGGNSLADSLVSFRVCLFSTEDPIPGPSRGEVGEDCMLGFLHQLVGVASCCCRHWQYASG